jgi:hypothetical protein
MKRFRLLGLGMALGMFAWLVPSGTAPALATSSVTGLQVPGQQAPSTPGTVPQQQPQTQQPMGPEEQQQIEQQQAQQQQQQQPKQVFTGKIEQQGKHLMFVDKNNNATYKISNKRKAKKYAGEDVRIVGTLNPSDNSIHISKIQRAS